MNVGLVGCGGISDKHLKAWTLLKGMKLVAVCDVIRERALAAARRWGVHSHYGDFETMLSREDLEFLSVCTPPFTHADMVCRALDAGVNVVCEKPLAMTAKEVERMTVKANAGTAKLTMICNELYNPALSRAMRVLESLRDQPRAAEFQVLKPADQGKHSIRGHWCHNIPGGPFGELIIHGISVLRHCLGDLTVGSIQLDKQGGSELRASLRSDKKRGNLLISLNSPRLQIMLDLYGIRNSVRADLFSGDVFLFRSDSKLHFAAAAAEATTQASVAMGNALGILRRAASCRLGRRHSEHMANIAAFVDSVLNGKALPLSLEDMRVLVSTQEQITELIDAYVSV